MIHFIAYSALLGSPRMLCTIWEEPKTHLSAHCPPRFQPAPALLDLQVLSWNPKTALVWCLVKMNPTALPGTPVLMLAITKAGPELRVSASWDSKASGLPATFTHSLLAHARKISMTHLIVLLMTPRYLIYFFFPSRLSRISSLKIFTFSPDLGPLFLTSVILALGYWLYSDCNSPFTPS